MHRGLELPSSPLTLANGTYGLWFGEHFEHHALVGPVLASDELHVLRQLLTSTSTIPVGPFAAQWTGHTLSQPADIDPDWQDVVVPLRDGRSAPAWLFRASSPDAPWVIHVQGIRTSRLVTLRSVVVAQRVGATSLVITYRGAGDGLPARASTLGQREWTDLADAVEYARAHGAQQIGVVAWSMGAGLALELLRHNPKAFDRLALVAPATNWRLIIKHGVQRAGLPTAAASAVLSMLRSCVGSRLVGLPAPIDFSRFDWTHRLVVSIPMLVVHSTGDDEIPFELTEAFAAAHPHATVVQSAAAPHGWEFNASPEVIESSLASFLSADETTEGRLG